MMKTAELTSFELYNFFSDMGESKELSAVHPQIFRKMKSQMIAMYKEVQAETPEWPAWKHARYEANRIVWPDYWLKKKKK